MNSFISIPLHLLDYKKRETHTEGNPRANGSILYPAVHGGRRASAETDAQTVYRRKYSWKTEKQLNFLVTLLSQ